MITRIELQQYRRLTDHHRRSPEARAFRRRLDAALDELPPVWARIIFLRYCCRLSWVAVGMRTNYSRAQVLRIDKKACKQLAEKGA